MENKITGHTRLVGLYATPIRHSVSPMIQNTAFQALGIDAVYLAFELGTDRLPQAIDSIRNLDMLGANLSMPNKMAAVPLMDDLSEAAKLVGAINTIVNVNGKLTGHITDGTGFMRSLKDMDIDIIGRKMTLIGAGGAATAIIVQAALDGVKEIAVYNRRDEFFEKVKEKLTYIKQQTDCNIHLHDLENESELAADVKDSTLLVNATGVGMKPDLEAAPISDFSIITKDLAVFDVIYTPRETRLLKEAKARGAKTANGLGMLLYQGAAAFELWTGKEMPIETVKSIIENS
ncbi:shikimate dehydrogenase [Enterococcus sp. BWT-B8]|uniref:shikimate dehydrogenase n=1 Tax=unclassified Enterococcus TaxID=2608891 RepID=UPI001E3D494A|nr:MULTISPECIES: shikimate dehydrogenase [unclassified Enterococcus]MCB5950628.1 shikimate dehydrogenase [Enterococcus sp. BWT-B8]MCB5955671.1 shikimate dehydrogenase [Enterococcus sp. CWB-B31]